MKSKIIYTFLLILLSINSITSQNITQTIKGKIIDIVTGEPLIEATVIINDSNPVLGTTTDNEGNYILENVEVGRHTLSISYLGYKTIITEEILLTSSKPFVLDVELDEDLLRLDAVVITAKKRDQANIMAVVSSRSFTIEESSRLAGGLSDPSRVAYNFAGVTFSAPQDNGVVIRGNSPSSVLWRLNGMDVSGAAHFGGGNLAGVGLVSIYSANILKGSSFFTGAFPAEYAGGTSGVFDIEFRKGNEDKAKHLIQLGVLGVDISTEGPLSKSNGSSYLINYRHGFIGYYGALAGGTEPYYQDVSFNLNFPTKKYGEFSLWGIGGLSRNVDPVGEYKNEFDEDEGTYDIKYREYEGSFLEKDIHFGMGAIGLNNKLRLGNSMSLHSNIGYTTNYYKNDTQYFDADVDTLNSGTFYPEKQLKNLENKFEVSSKLYARINSRITNETGLRLSSLSVKAYAYEAEIPTSALSENLDIQESANNVTAYTQFRFNITPELNINAGATSTKFELVNEITFEPRIGLKWDFLPFANIGLAYGRHSKREELKTYYFKNPLGNINELQLSKADHYVASLGFRISKNVNLTIEGYYQSLFDVPVINESSYSFANYTNLWEVNNAIVNTGTGKNMGIDLTLERKMSNGFYYLLTGSIFDSKYTDAQNIDRNTRFNRGYLTTLAFGKEFVVSDNNLLGFNMNVTYMGGVRLTPYLETESYEAKEIIYNTDRIYEDQASPETWLNMGITYKINKSKSTRTWGLDFQNALITEQMAGYKYNLRTNTIEEDKTLFLLPNFYYKIEF